MPIIVRVITYFPALARTEDEEAVRPVVGDPGDQHDTNDPGRGDRGEEPEHQQRAAPISVRLAVQACRIPGFMPRLSNHRPVPAILPPP